MRDRFSRRVLPGFLFSLLVIAGGLARLPDQCRATETGGSPQQIQKPVIAGTWYPGSPSELRRVIEGFLANVPEESYPGRLAAIVSPHAGYNYSGQVAAHSYKLLQRHRFATVIVIAPSHHVRFDGVATLECQGFETPLGIVPVDRELLSELQKREPRIRHLPEAFAREHSLEIQLPFLQVVMPDFNLVPLVMGIQDPDGCNRLAETIAQSIKDKPVLIVASSDLSHFHSYDSARAMDEILLEKIRNLDPNGLGGCLKGGSCEACGGEPVMVAMLAAKKLGANQARILKYANSGDVTGDKANPRGVVGYAAAAMWIRDADRSASEPASSLNKGAGFGLTDREKEELRSMARRVIEARCKGLDPPKAGELTPKLREPRGAFVTLKKHGALRGCIGHIIATRPLAETVLEMAGAAAFKDPRFAPLTASELDELEIEISVLTPLLKVNDIEEIKVGVHGLIIKQDGAMGLLLPQVPTEYGWDRNAFLENTCLKARLPRNAWKDKNTEIYMFSADVF